MSGCKCPRIFRNFCQVGASNIGEDALAAKFAGRSERLDDRSPDYECCFLTRFDVYYRADLRGRYEIKPDQATDPKT